MLRRRGESGAGGTQPGMNERGALAGSSLKASPLRKLSLTSPADIISPSKTTALFPLIGKGLPHTSKKPSAYADTHIGHEGNYI